MIKKYIEYIESKIANLGNYFNGEELEDQFLRLKEVLGCRVRFYNIAWLRKSEDITKSGYGEMNHITGEVIHEDLEKRKLVEDELDQIKRRMESMYPIRLTYRFRDAHRNFKMVISYEINIFTNV